MTNFATLVERGRAYGASTARYEGRDWCGVECRSHRIKCACGFDTMICQAHDVSRYWADERCFDQWWDKTWRLDNPGQPKIGQWFLPYDGYELLETLEN